MRLVSSHAFVGTTTVILVMYYIAVTIGLLVGIETLRSILRHTINKRFPALTVQAEQVSQSISDLTLLQQIIDDMIDTQTEDESHKVLIQAIS